MPNGDLRSKIAPLGRRLLARQQRVTRATGVELARSVIGRRKPLALQSATRLAVGRSLTPRPAAIAPEPAQAAELPEYISPFAASVLFGDEPAADSDQAQRYAAYQEREEARFEALRTGAVPRGQVQEGPAVYEPREDDGRAGGQFRLSPRPSAAVPPVTETLPAALQRSVGAPQRLSRSKPTESAGAAAEPPSVALSAKPHETSTAIDAPTPGDASIPGGPSTASEGSTPSPVPAEPESATPVVRGDEPAPAPVPVRLKERPVEDRPAVARMALKTSPDAEPSPAPPSDPAFESSPAAEADTPAPSEPERREPEPPSRPPERAASSGAPAPSALSLAEAAAPATPEPPAAEPPAPEPPTPGSIGAPPGASETESSAPSRAEVQTAVDAPRPVRPIPIRRVSRREARPERPVVRRRAAEPPPVVEVPPPVPELPLAVAPAAVEPVPAPRGLFRRVAHAFRPPRRLEEPQAAPAPVDEPATAVEPAPVDEPAAPAEPRTPGDSAPAAQPVLTRAPPVERAPAAVESAPAVGEAAPPPEPRTSPVGLHAAVARLLRQPTGSPLPPGLEPSPVRGPGPSGGGAPPAPTTPAQSTPGGGGTGPAPSPGGGPALGDDGGQGRTTAGGNVTVEAQNVSTGPIQAGGSASLHAGTTMIAGGGVEAGADQTITPGMILTAPGSVQAGGNQTVDSGGAVIARGGVQSGGSTSVIGGAGVQVKGNLVGGSATIDGSKVTLGKDYGLNIGHVSDSTVVNQGAPVVGGSGGGAPAGAARMARLPADRPPPVPIRDVRLQSAPASIARTPQPGPVPELPPARPVGTSGAGLAAATGGAIARSPAGAETVYFPPPPFEAVAEPVIQRADESSSSAAPSPGAGQAAPAAPPASADIQEIAEKVMEVLKREAMIERERRGDLT